LTCLVFFLATFATGCHAIQPSTPIAVTVRDAETHAPVSGATVHMWRYGSHEKERDVSFTTGADGVAHVRLAPPDEGGVFASVSSPNCLPVQVNLPQDISDALTSAKPFHPYSGPPLSITVDVFAGPRPTVELVLPSGFRGLVKAKVCVNAEGQWTPGQRAFSYKVPADGVVRVEGPPVFGQATGPDFVAKFADDTPLPKDGKGDVVALRWIRREGNEVCFAVGTITDETNARRSLGDLIDNTPNSKPSERPANSGGGRRGGMGGRGGRGR
jgi:hypothetical protein